MKGWFEATAEAAGRILSRLRVLTQEVVVSFLHLNSRLNPPTDPRLSPELGPPVSKAFVAVAPDGSAEAEAEIGEVVGGVVGEAVAEAEAGTAAVELGGAEVSYHLLAAAAARLIVVLARHRACSEGFDKGYLGQKGGQGEAKDTGSVRARREQVAQ